MLLQRSQTLQLLLWGFSNATRRCNNYFLASATLLPVACTGRLASRTLQDQKSVGHKRPCLG